MNNDNDQTEDILDAVFNKIILKKKFLFIFNLLLPLDIDLQSCAILAEQKVKNKATKDPNEYLKIMFKDGVSYLKKCSEFKAKIKQLMKYHGINQKELGELCKQLEPFLKRLHTQAKTGNPSYDELQNHNWGVPRIKSFHDWYCALAECLMSHEQ